MSDDTDRMYEVTKDWSLLRGSYETVFILRCYGHGIDCQGGGVPNTYFGPDGEVKAQTAGKAWVETGISPAHQGSTYGITEADLTH